MIYKYKVIPKYLMVISLVLLILTTTIFVTTFDVNKDDTSTVVFKYGSRGTTVKQIQQKLINYGYAPGPADGIFGYRTYTAVKAFQRNNGLTVDGLVGNNTLAALGITVAGSSSSSFSSSDEYLLARCVHGEARGEPYTGQVAVAAVVLNRVRDSRFPNTIAGVIYQPGAFTSVSDGQINLSPDQSAKNAARDAMNGWDPTNGCVYFYNPATSTSAWIWSRPVLLSIGKHNFAK